jgi:hypothetical protein
MGIVVGIPIVFVVSILWLFVDALMTGYGIGTKITTAEPSLHDVTYWKPNPLFPGFVAVFFKNTRCHEVAIRLGLARQLTILRFSWIVAALLCVIALGGVWII